MYDRASNCDSVARGFSLIEVLVAVLVLSVGITGVVTLQVTSKRTNFEAVQRATAAAMTQDIIERMRVNPGQLAIYTNNGAGRILTGNSMSSTDCTAGCVAAQIAQLDLFQWEQALNGITEQSGGAHAGGLTVPTACITGPNGGSGTYTVAIAWRGLNRLSNPTTNACGAGTGLYDSTSAADVHRRVIVIATFIAEPV